MKSDTVATGHRPFPGSTGPRPEAPVLATAGQEGLEASTLQIWVGRRERMDLAVTRICSNNMDIQWLFHGWLGGSITQSRNLVFGVPKHSDVESATIGGL